MKTRITSTPKRCLKCEIFTYLPDENDVNIKTLRYFASRTPGRIVVYDEYGRKIGNKAFAFESLSEAMSIVEKIRRKLVYKRTKQ